MWVSLLTLVGSPRPASAVGAERGDLVERRRVTAAVSIWGPVTDRGLSVLGGEVISGNTGFRRGERRRGPRGGALVSRVASLLLPIKLHPGKRSPATGRSPLRENHPHRAPGAALPHDHTNIPLLRRGHQLQVCWRNPDEGWPATDPVAQGPGHGLHAEHDRRLVVVEALAQL